MLSSIKHIFEFFNRREKIQLTFLLVAIFFTGISQAVGVASVLPFMNVVMQPEIALENKWLFMVYDYLGFQDINSYIFFLGMVMFAVVLTANLISGLATWLKFRFIFHQNHSLSKRLLKKYLSMPYGYFLNANSSELSRNILDEVNQITQRAILPFMTLVTRVVMVAIILIMLLLVEPFITMLAAAIIGGAYTFIYFLTRKKLKMTGQERLSANKGRYKTATEALGGVKEIKLMGKEAAFLERYAAQSKKNAALRAFSSIIGNVPRYALETLAFGGIIILVLVLIRMEGGATGAIPMITFFTLAMYRMMPALQEIFSSFTLLKFYQPTVEKIHYDMFSSNEDDKKKIRRDSEPEIVPLPFKKKIEIRDLSYVYPQSHTQVLHDINLTIPYKSSVAFVGETGAGKTTLVDIILGLLSPTKGYLAVDGEVVEGEKVKRWQRNLGYVPQHIYLSDDTVAGNIAFGIPGEVMDTEAVEKAAKVAGLHDFITGLPDGYNTVVGERGVRLSGGQIQRIGIARALYHDPEVLVLDEATSALDGTTEDNVFSAISHLAEAKTLIIIAHRLTTVKNCNVIFFLDEGRVVAQGTYEELLRNNEKFRAMSKLG